MSKSMSKRVWLFVMAFAGVMVVAASFVAAKKPASAQPPPTPTTEPADSAVAEPLVGLAAAKQLPALFAQRTDLQFNANGLDLFAAHGITTAAGDYLNKDFTFDVVYLSPGGKNDKGMFLGLGAGAPDKKGQSHANHDDAITLHLHGGKVMLHYQKGNKGHDDEMAKPGKAGAGPNMIRLRKRGDSLIVAFCPNYNGTFTAQVTRVIDSIKIAAPEMTATASFLFAHGQGTLEQMRLVVEADSGPGHGSLALPAQVVEGQLMKQMLIADANAAAGKQFSMDPVAAPKGLTLSPAGELQWTPAHDQVGSHHLRITVSENGRSTVEQTDIEVVSIEDLKAAGGDLTKVAGLYELEVQAAVHQVTPGLGGTLLLLEGNQLRRLGPDGLLVQQTIKLPKMYARIGERADCFVALSETDKCVDVIDKQTLQVRQSAQMAYAHRHDLCLHPLKPISYVSVERTAGRGGADSQIVVFDEKTGDAREPKGCRGSWVRISPDGARLYTGYREVYATGRIAGYNPTTLEPIPEYGDISKLLIYDNTGPLPRPLSDIDGAGANGQEIALSPDGKRLSYLSLVGYPIHTGNVPAWDTSDLTKRPVTYVCKDVKADGKHAAFHPTLPIAAVTAELVPGGAVLFDRETGQAQSNRLEVKSPLPAKVKLTDLYFSPDGRSILLDGDAKGRRFLKKVKLVLTPAEAARLK